PGRTRRDEDVDLEVHELGREARKPLRPALRVADLQCQVPPLDIAELAQALRERSQSGIRPRHVLEAAHQEADMPDLGRRLRFGSEWAGEDSENEKGDGQLAHGPPPDGRDATPRGRPGSTARIKPRKIL